VEPVAGYFGDHHDRRRARVDGAHCAASAEVIGGSFVAGSGLKYGLRASGLFA
jgi:hypothetical protein